MIKWFRKDKKAARQQFFAQLRWFWGLCRRYPGAIAWYIFLGLLGTAMGLAASVLSKRIIDIVTGLQTGGVGVAVAAYLGMQIGKIGLNCITGFISERITVQVSQSIKGEIFDRIVHARWQDISQYHSGDLLARASRDTGTLAGSVVGWLPTLVIGLFQFVGAFCLIAYYDPTLALLALGTAPVVLLSSGFTTGRMRRHSKRMQELGAELTGFHAEAFSNLQLIKSFGIVDTYSKRLRQLQLQQRQETLSYKKFSMLTSSVLSLAGLAVGCLCFLWSAWRLWKHYITFGEMTLFLQMAGVLSGAFSTLVGMVGHTIRMTTAAGRVMEVTQLPMEEYAHGEQVAQMLNQPVIVRLQNVDFAYRDGKPVLQKGSLRADAGQVVALVGPSGGGKTTILRLILGIMEPDSGLVCLESSTHSVAACAGTRRLLAYVPQENILFSGSLRENLTIMNPNATDAQLWEALETACAADFVRELGLDATVGERGNGLSQGQIQRLAIARALLSNAPVLLLDEATSALDIPTEKQLLANLTGGRQGRTCIVTTHRESMLESAHRIYRIENGNITQEK